MKQERNTEKDRLGLPEGIAGSENWTAAEPINKGWSADLKYRVTAADGSDRLLRLVPAAKAEAKRLEFEWMRRAAALDIPMPKPLSFGLCGDGEYVYSLLTWIDGEDAEPVVSAMEPERAYRLGRQAGEWLRLLHGLPAPQDAPGPADTVRAEMKRKREAYASCGYRLPYERELLERIEACLPLLDGTAPVFRHGDYHPGNMIIGPDGGLNIIDFNRSGFGDPCRDFNRLVTFTHSISPPFARGQLDGYLSSGPADPDFFKRVSLYCASESLYSILWAIPFGEPEIGDTLRRSREIFDAFDGFRADVPVWYEAPPRP
ncbi:phosphotransferase [Saccharibacillus sp. CPCC 101409]|uniref:phosphotransferase family protein n=1 Tax=Saccharibacillus sp. CPCC 101409 TaxID=3058041 RepID=UPI002670E46E|nr:phosphotransferase [Saccharibacillus sp. CPCC 101409]MDO3410158.1 phosphotransferase [Saccharibacillus sp. CPCC 101409]